MHNSQLTVDELLTQPQVRQNLSPDEIDQLRGACLQDPARTGEPLYIRILSGTGAWFAAFFLILFLALADLIDGGTSAIIFGILLFSAAIIVSRHNKDTFADQLALALAMAGNILVLYGPTDIFRHFPLLGLVLIQLGVCLVIYPLFTNVVFRYLAPLLLALLAIIWIVEEQVPHLIHLLIGAETLLFGLLILQPRRPVFLTPLLYASASMLPATLLFMNFSQLHAWDLHFRPSLTYSSLLIGAAMIYLFMHLAGSSKRLQAPWLIMACTTVALLALFTTPGILAAIGLLVLGYHDDNRFLTGLAYFFLPAFLVLYYYALNVDLAYKSWILAGSGLLLLGMRWGARRFLQPEVESV